MTQWTSPSGSRWEPVPQAGSPGLDEPVTEQTMHAVPVRTGQTGRRRRRGPVLVALIALLSIGAVSAGAYEQSSRSRDEGTSVGTSGGPAAGDPGTPDGYGPRHRDHEAYGDRHRSGSGSSDGEADGPQGAPS